MDKKKFLKISRYILLTGMSIFTVLFFLDIKFVVLGLNILEWTMAIAAIWIFVRLCRWASRENTGKRMFVVIAIAIAGTFAAFSLAICGGLPGYIEGTEPQTRRTFVVEYYDNMFHKGSAKLYERFGSLLLTCDVKEYEGEFLHVRPGERQIYISDDGKKIVVAYFFLKPIFSVPLE